MHGPFASIEDAQAAVDTWRKQYNTDRPHQSLAMGFPAARFTRASSDVLGLRVPAELARTAGSAEPVSIPDADASPLLSGPAVDRVSAGAQAVELDRVVPPSGNLWLAGQQIWLGPAMTAAPSGCGPDWTGCTCCWTATGSRPCRPGSMPATWPASPRPVPGPPGRRRCPRHPVT